MDRIFCISGPTASGKSKLAEDLAKKINRRLINADAFQFYKEIPILSNQPKKIKDDWLFFSDRSLLDPLNAGDYGKRVLPHLDSKALLVGTGLYLGAALYGLDENGVKGTPFQQEPRVEFLMLVLSPERDELYRRIDERVDEMIEQGALEEAKVVFQMIDRKKISSTHPVLKAIGLKHLLAHLRSEWGWDECIRVWKRDTRRLAKRQWTWLRKFCPESGRISWLSSAEGENLKQIDEFFGLPFSA